MVVNIIEVYYPDGVSRLLDSGGSNFIGFVYENTVLKYPWNPEDHSVLEIEVSIYTALPPHPRILQYKGRTEHGLLLGRAINGSLETLLRDPNKSPLSTVQRLKLALQASEATAHIHRHNVLHCDLNASNFVLDESFDLILCDFQGRLLHADGSVFVNGGVQENPEFRMPNRGHDADRKPDIFALGSTIYHIMKGHQPFPCLDSIDDEVEIEEKFELHQFSDLEPALAGRVVHNCWKGLYTSADEIVQDLEALTSA